MTLKTIFVQGSGNPNNDNDNNNETGDYVATRWVRVNLLNQNQTLDQSLPLLPVVLSGFENERHLVSFSTPLSHHTTLTSTTTHCLKLGYVLHDKLCMIKQQSSSSSSTEQQQRRERDIADVAYMLSEQHLAEVGGG
ncbi:hypothetical protein QBC45DRAFT_443802 [Copromyces sp. CBS 386.78]|nr:hypothetical protein QBC45DRAFT_443802 [Copromyces sp. CBS 386.78]